MGVDAYSQWLATIRADKTLIKFAEMMTLAFRELLQSQEPAETQRPLFIEGRETAATGANSANNMLISQCSAVEQLRLFSLKPAAENMCLVAKPTTPLLLSADKPG
jgi:hypothetical protein